jgi:hypothetical protein
MLSQAAATGWQKLQLPIRVNPPTLGCVIVSDA